MENENFNSFEKVEFVDSPEQLDINQPAQNFEQPTQEVAEPAQEQPQVETTQQPVQEQVEAPSSQSYSEQDVESAVFSYLSEKLGREVRSLEDFSQPQRTLDERVESIAKFVEETGRDPFDWFAYQALNPSEMEDMEAVKTNLRNSYRDLSNEEIDLLASSKYKLDEDLYDEAEVKMAKLQLKIDANEARAKISEMRDAYKLPQKQQTENDADSSIINEEWISLMSKEVDSLEGLEFDLGDGNSFTFGIDDNYRSELKNKNAKLDEFFDPYVDDNGNWDYDMLSSHRALIDNIDSIVRSVYRQGMSDGQRGLVNKAANVDPKQPSVSGETNSQPSIMSQINEALSGNSWTFNL
jgi:hypothetical protein